MSTDLERTAMSTSKQSEVMRLDITDVTSPLPEQVKARWGPYKQRPMQRPEVNIEQIQARMAAAERKRQVRSAECRKHHDRTSITCAVARVRLDFCYEWFPLPYMFMLCHNAVQSL